MISKRKYEEIIQNYGYTSSFAIWGKDVGDLSVFCSKNKPWERINDKYVIVAMNPAKPITERLRNFHCLITDDGKHKDSRLMKSITGTPLEGSFMTDMSHIVSADSKNVKYNKEDIKSFINKIESIGQFKKIILLFKKQEKEIDKWFREEGINIDRILNYNKQAARAVKTYCLNNNIPYEKGKFEESYIRAVHNQIEKIFKDEKDK